MSKFFIDAAARLKGSKRDRQIKSAAFMEQAIALPATSKDQATDIQRPILLADT